MKNFKRVEKDKKVVEKKSTSKKPSEVKANAEAEAVKTLEENNDG